ncbi:ABC transporter ATP-binding protein [Bacillus sp. RG28]|uniref:ABC transporter ATP-binding protein n=1 Tax=Gottfriedia endophytica TaxID=2820819 RepID=A0A940NM82_9BACI|nr:ABC transporter ATP-binding protein [Gottfriedia endophytica]MBP0724110.1 ABC transporter ATP-binding protein [Gottfriedia endophytica]
MKAELRVENISVSFPKTGQILDSISLHVNQGEFVSIIGPSGSGKSTIFQSIGGVLLPEKGEIFLGDKKITGETGHISYMPQHNSLLPWRNVLQNVLLGQELHKKTNLDEAKSWLSKVGLSEYEKAFPHQLSGGMKQRVAFIRALISPASLMLLDEPFSALDEFTRLDMQKWLLSIWEKEKKSILFITHNIEEALFLSDRIYILSERPAKIVKEIKVEFPRPRNEELLMDDYFQKMKKEIFAELKGSR